MRPTLGQAIAAALTLLIVLAAGSALLGAEGVRQLWTLRRERARLRTATAVLVRDNEGLRATIVKLKGDALFLEELARDELGFVRPGERVYRFRPRPQPAP